MRVFAKDEATRKALKHLPSNKNLGETIADGAEWPDDNFTHRRLRDGDILSEAPPAQASERASETPRASEAKAAPKPEAAATTNDPPKVDKARSRTE